MTFQRDWKEEWVDRMGLIVALSGEARFSMLTQFKRDMAEQLTNAQIAELKFALRRRFTPSNGTDGCTEAMASVHDIVKV